MAPEERAGPMDAAELSAEERAEVERLLVQHDKSGAFLDEPALPRRPDTEELPADWVPPAVSDVGRKIGPYRLVELIGEGGMGAVYLAERDDRQYEHRVAVKLMRRASRDALVRFQQERQMLAALSHPNIARLFDGGATGDGQPYLVMEYVEGERIDAYCDNNGLGIDDRLKLFRQVCAAVTHAHRNLLVHRDLKPANILVNGEGVPVLIDFGIAKSLENDAGATRLGERPMTPAYASPEQVTGKAITTATDVYSLGVVLYELLTGKKPYRLEDTGDDGSDVDLQDAIRHQDPTRPSVAVRGDATTGTHARQLRGDLDTIVLKALRKEPEQRYASADEFGADIGRYLDHLPITARPASLSYRLRKFVRRNRIAVTVSAIAAVALLIFVLALIRQTRIAKRQTVTAERALGFMVSAFKVSDPDEARGNPPTMREVLDQGADRIREELAGEDDLRATLFAAIGEVYTSLGRFDDAEELLMEAHQLRRGTDGEAVSLYQLGELEYFRRNYSAAENYYRQALALMPDDDNTTARGRVLRGLGLTQVFLDQNTDGKALLTEALQILRQHFTDDHIEILRCIEGLAFVARNQGDYSRAEALFEQVVAIRRQEGRGPALGRSLADLGIVRFLQGDLTNAKLLLEGDALPMLREAMGNDNTYVAELLGKLVAVLIELGDDDGAEAVIREILDILPEGHSGVGIAMHNLGKILAQRGDLDAAEEMVRKALPLERAAFGEGSEVASSLCLLGGFALERGDAETAYKKYDQCLRLITQVIPDNPLIAFALWGLGRSTEALQGCDAAVPWYRQTYAVRREALGVDNALAATAGGFLGACLAELGIDFEAEQLLIESLATLQASGLNDDDHRICKAAGRLADFYSTRGQEEKLREVAFPSCA